MNTKYGEFIGLCILFLFCSTGLLNAADDDNKNGFEKLFGDDSKYIHSFFSVGLSGTDNVYNHPQSKFTDFYTSLIAGIGGGFPPVQPQSPNTQTAEGFLNTENPKTIQSFLLYATAIEKYLEYDDNSSQNHRLGGIIQYNTQGGLHFDVIYRDIQSIDNTVLNNSIEQNRYQTTISRVILRYDGIESFRSIIGYSQTGIEYQAERNAFQNRETSTFETGFFLSARKNILYLWNT